MAHRSSSVHSQHEIAFFKIGGTWDMVKVADRLTGSGGFDDTMLAAIERKCANASIDKAEREVCGVVDGLVRDQLQHADGVEEHLRWVPHVSKYVTGQFYSLYSGDSSHLRASLIAPFVAHLVKFMNDHPNIQVIGAQGTDTADLALLPLLDVLLFDAELLPVLFTGANRSQHEWNSDAPKNFFDLIQLTGAHLPSGSYWVFASHLFRASDMLKIDPTESRRIENFTTFFAPRLTSRYTKKVIGENALFAPNDGKAVHRHHPIRQLSTQKLFEAMNAVEVVDLDALNPVHEDVARITSDKQRAVVIAAFALGNANNRIRAATVAAARQGKLVVIIDKSLLGVVTERYAAGLMSVNAHELKATKAQTLSGYRLNKATARAILTRAVFENCDQRQAQQLIARYCDSRQLLG